MRVRYTEKRENYVMIRVQCGKEDPSLNEVNKWCLSRGVGKRVNMDTFSFKNESELSMFYLKWVDE